jgi:hypothetical protein
VTIPTPADVDGTLSTMEDRFAVVSWDHREQPDWDKIGAAVRELSGGRLDLRDVVDTGSDDYGLVVSTRLLDDASTAEAYRRAKANWEREPTKSSGPGAVTDQGRR